MKKFLFLVMMGCVSLVNAQNYVTIPDANFAKYLREVVPNAVNGNQLDTSSADVKNLKTINAEARAIKNLDGVQYFVGLDTLDVGNGDQIPDTNRNSFSTLPILPKNLNVLICGNTSLDSLPALPKSLKILKCYKNLLKKLPILSDSLVYLDCSVNKLVNLPLLPNYLTNLQCYDNLLTELPQLPNKLLYISCYSNELSSLPQLPNSLIDIVCAYNQLTTLPQLPDSLVSLKCFNNLLTVLPKLPNKLSKLHCFQNQLVTLPDLPENLTILECNRNQLISLPSLPNLLYELNCGSNQLTELPQFPNSLNIIHIYNNQLTSLPDLPESLLFFECYNNKLTSIPKLPNSIQTLNCSYNQIKCFPTFPNVKKFTYYVFDISNNPFTCLPNYVPAMDSLTLTYPLCNENDINNQAGCEIGKRGVLGYSFFNDTTIANIPVVLLDENKNQLGVTYTALNGVYQFLKDSANYHVQIDTTNIPFKVARPISNDTLVSLTTETPFADSVNFYLACKDGYDVGIRSMSTTGIVFPGQPHTLSIAAGDMSNWFDKNCASNISGQLQLTITGPVKYAENLGHSTPTINGNVYTYDIADFGKVNFLEDFALGFVTDTTAKADDQICVHAQITPKNGDYNQANNDYDFCYSVINSHDPNLKEVYPAHFKPGYEGYFTYTIHFQNTGNAPAFNIRLLDTLSSKFDLTTFEVLNYSHENRVSLNRNILNVYFKNIHLMDSTTDEKASHGFIQYRIKALKPVSESDEIKNTAHIYFDFNEAIVTNTTLSKANKSLSGLTQIKTANFVVYPNPARNFVTLENITNTNRSTNLTVTDLQGKVVYNSTTNFERKHSIDVSSFNAGVYFIKVENDAYTESVRFVKQ